MRTKRVSVLVFLFILLLLVALGSLVWGQIDIPIKNTLSLVGYQMGLPGFSTSDFTPEQKAVLWYIRMPRTIVGILVGAALGVSGAVMQGVFSNPLADPG
ncbi:MAG: iron chelate uptake ABC transporter family permease subunit, partial [Acidaminococcaceae bacterium]|nr:iron chelate uptake ABC transporter family permease subunit [Acidaminococcaceae bacterium]